MLGLLSMMRPHFRVSPLMYDGEKSSIMSNSADNIMPGLESSKSNAQSYESVNKRLDYIKLLVDVVLLFQNNFVSIN